MRVGLVQMNILWEAKEQNFQQAESFFESARLKGMDLLLFPEMSMTGFSMATDTTAESEDDPRTLLYFKKLAEKYQIAVGIGYTWKDINGVFNQYALIEKDGETAGIYSKIHPFSYSGEHLYYQGGTEIVTCTIQGVVISPFICYDLRFPEVFQKASETADLIVVAANWPQARQKHWDILLQARAIENQCYIAGINRVGEGDGLSYSGGSALISPQGEVLDQYYMEETLICGEVNTEVVKDYRKSFPVKQDRRTELYR